MENGSVKVHYFADGKILCGREKDGAEFTSDLPDVTCGSCQRIITKKLEQKGKREVPAQRGKVNVVSVEEIREPTPEDFAKFHLSDGSQTVCGLKNDKIKAGFEIEKVSCLKCQERINAAYSEAKDPIVRVTIHNKDIKEDGVDFQFTFEGRSYHCLNGAIHRLPQSVVNHLRGIKYPVKAYKEGQESGQSIVVTGEYHRFTIGQPLPVE
jgi:copper chaperone CopZ